jgi:hypothetical protein
MDTRDRTTGKFLRITEAMARTKQDSREETIEVWKKDPSLQAFTNLLNPRSTNRRSRNRQSH